MADSDFSLAGKTILQVGGSGLLGQALTTSLTAAGARLVVGSRQTTARTATAGGDNVQIERVDVTSEESLQALRDRILETRLRIDGLVFNTVARPMNAFQDPLATWKSSMEVNATGLFATLRIFGDAMVENRAGSIVSIASIQGMVGTNSWLYEGTTITSPPDYFFHKGGLLNLTRYLAAHYGPHNIRVNAVSPGGICNPQRPQAPEFLERYSAMTMLGRMAEAHEIGSAVVYLLSDASRYVTGINLPVDGGYTAK
ncbi:MAG: SDR family oxidoreductase [Opitutaceae bacterium]